MAKGPSSLTSGKVAIAQLTVAMPPGMSDEEATEWLGTEIHTSLALQSHGVQVQIGTAPVGSAAPGGPRLELS